MLKWFATKFEHRRAALQAQLEKSLEVATQPKQPLDSSEWRKRAIAYLNENRLIEAQVCYRRGIQADPNDATCYSGLGYVLGELGQTSESQTMLLKAIGFDSRDFDAHYMLGNLAKGRGDLTSAIDYYQRALKVQPDFMYCRRDLCIALAQTGHTNEARTAMGAGQAFLPDSAEFHFFSGNLYLAADDAVKAAADFERAAVVNPRDPSILINLGVAQLRLQDVFTAIATYQRILQLDPENVQAFVNIAAAFQLCGQLDLAVQNYRKALAINPEHLNAHQNLLYALSYDPTCLPFEYLNEARRFGSRVAARAKPYSSWLCPPWATSDRPLRIGFVSGDLRTHPVGFFLEGILSCIDPVKLTLIAYSNCINEDELSERIKPLFGAWNDVASLTDEILAQKIHADKIDVLVDLAGHTERNRLSLFPWRPAPVQVSWLGYWASTGVAEIDFILVDDASVSKSDQQHFSEKLWYLPGTRLCLTPPSPSSPIEVQDLPAYRKGHVTFGSYQILSKINDASLIAWSKVLSSLPTARLRIQNWQLSHPRAHQAMLEKLASANVDVGRVDLFGGTMRDDYLASYSEVDIVLDTFPFPGGTTTAEALWMGVPTITLSGETLLGRQGESLLRCVGLGDWVAASQQQYTDLALAHALDLAALSELRACLRDRLLASPLFDTRRFAQQLELAFIGMRQSV
jgi:protein O-GlcNAc transferase